MSDDVRKKILERRTKFVAAALASVAATASCEHKPPISAEPCLSAPPMEVDASPPGPDAAGPDAAGPDATAHEPAPAVCLSPMPPPKPPLDDAGVGPKPAPVPCLSQQPPLPPPPDAGPKPQPCLKVAPKHD